METAARTVAILCDSPPLSSLLTAILGADRTLRVRPFASMEALAAYMQLCPVKALVLDFDRGVPLCERELLALRHDAKVAFPGFSVIALTRAIDQRMRHACVRTGIAELIVKPMSPGHLLERVRARLAAPLAGTIVAETSYRGPERRNRISMPLPENAGFARAGDNVVPLFRD